MADIEKIENTLHHYPQHRKFGNPAPLGLFGFAATTLTLSLYNVHARHIEIPNVVVGMALGYGGLAQFVAGMWEFAVGNTFGATAFSSYGAFWFSFAAILIPSSGIGEAYTTDLSMFTDALGIYLLSWMVITFLFFLGSLRKSIGLTALFFFLTMTFMVLAVGNFKKDANVEKAGGYIGIITALIAFYCGLAEMLSPTDAFTLPLGKYRTD